MQAFDALDLAHWQMLNASVCVTTATRVVGGHHMSMFSNKDERECKQIPGDV